MATLLRRFSQLKTSRVPIYESKDYASLVAIKTNFLNEAKQALGNKFAEFVPFYLESVRPTQKISIFKRFILKFELDPETKLFHIADLQLGFIDHRTANIDDVVPVTFPEYESAHMMGKLCQPADWQDLEMLYLNKRTSEFYVFDKESSWKEEGVNHPLLSWAARFKEYEWTDFTAGNSADANGGKVTPTF